MSRWKYQYQRIADVLGQRLAALTPIRTPEQVAVDEWAASVSGSLPPLPPEGVAAAGRLAAELDARLAGAR